MIPVAGHFPEGVDDDLHFRRCGTDYLQARP